jgi:hypothetical protein
VERWRVAFAIVSALAALPLLAIDNVSSADPAKSGPAELNASRVAEDPAFDLLASRAADWGQAREMRRRQSVDEAAAIAQQAIADEAVRLADEARQAEDAARRAEVAKKADATKRAAEALRKAQDAANKADAAKAAQAAARAAASSGTPTTEQWARLRACESGGNYGAISAGGRFRGAYQFDQQTWDVVTAQADPQLQGVDPATAAPADQDAVARALYRSRGASPWPRCGAALR